MNRDYFLLKNNVFYIPRFHMTKWFPFEMIFVKYFKTQISLKCLIWKCWVQKRIMLCMFNNLGRFSKLHYAHSVWTWTYKQHLGKTIFSDHNRHAETGFRKCHSKT